MFCEKCGAGMPENSKFCESCGTAVSVSTAGNGSPGAPPVQAAAPMAPPQPVQPVQMPVQPAYMPPPQQPHYNRAAGYGGLQPHSEPLKVSNYIGMFFLSAIPIAGFIFLLLWAFGSHVNLNKKNYARAVLVMSLIFVGFWIIIMIISAAVGISIMGDMF